MDFEYAPKLTLTPEADEKAEEAVVSAAAAQIEVPAETVDAMMEQLSDVEKQAIKDFAEKIDITDANIVLQYGAGAQKNISDFSAAALGNVRTKDMGEVGDMLGDLVVELKGLKIDPEEKKGFLGFFKRAGNQIASLKAQYDKAEVNVNRISEELEKHQIVLLKDVAMLDKMYELNQAYFKELSMYILAGKEKLATERATTLVELKTKAEASGLPEDAQAYNDFVNMCNRFEKKLHDLELTRMISIQMSPQIRLIQNNDSLMVEKIQTSLANTIPLWKSQMVLALGMAHSKQAMEAQREVTDDTNELLRKNSEMLKTGSIDIAVEAERGIVDLDTLKQTNQNLIDTLEEVRRIQAEGSQKRREAEVELGRIEAELKNKLLEMKG
ncbi:MAG: toxic anion resistance protein [Oscillospiraceae bacterium]|nr:toxic anion resistance protein [Oscillospiraceae bacterium]